MPEGFRAAIIMGPSSYVELDSVCFSMQFGQPSLVGEATSLVEAAGYNGQLYYFPLQRAYGVPVILGGHRGKPKFWWLFKQFRVPEAGVMFPFSWIHTQHDAVNMEIAEFLVPIMNDLLDSRLETDEGLRDADLDTWLAELVVMLTGNPNIKQQIRSIVPDYIRDVAPDGEASPPMLQSYTLWMGDQSAIIVATDGYKIQEAQEYMVPVKDSKNRRTTEFEIVKISMGSMVSSGPFH